MYIYFFLLTLFLFIHWYLNRPMSLYSKQYQSGNTAEHCCNITCDYSIFPEVKCRLPQNGLLLWLLPKRVTKLSMLTLHPAPAQHTLTLLSLEAHRQEESLLKSYQIKSISARRVSLPFHLRVKYWLVPCFLLEFYFPLEDNRPLHDLNHLCSDIAYRFDLLISFPTAREHANHDAGGLFSSFSETGRVERQCKSNCLIGDPFSDTHVRPLGKSIMIS